MIELKDLILNSINYYLKNTKFGIKSFWKHGSYGQNLAKRSRDWLLKKDIILDENKAILVALVIMKSHSWTLRKIIIDTIAFSEILSVTMLLDRISRYSREIKDMVYINSVIEELWEVAEERKITQRDVNNLYNFLCKK